MKGKPFTHKKRLEDNYEHTLILFNDDYNTFDHVIESSIEICGHDPVQAEQCAVLAHHKGSCEVKAGTKNVLLSMQSGLLERNLTCEVK